MKFVILLFVCFVVAFSFAEKKGCEDRNGICKKIKLDKSNCPSGNIKKLDCPRKKKCCLPPKKVRKNGVKRILNGKPKTKTNPRQIKLDKNIQNKQGVKKTKKKEKKDEKTVKKTKKKEDKDKKTVKKTKKKEEKDKKTVKKTKKKEEKDKKTVVRSGKKPAVQLRQKACGRTKNKCKQVKGKCVANGKCKAKKLQLTGKKFCSKSTTCTCCYRKNQACREKKKCTRQNGKCQFKWETCDGKKKKNFCKGSKKACVCCIPKTCTDPNSGCSAAGGECLLDSSKCDGEVDSSLCGGSCTCCIRETSSTTLVITLPTTSAGGSDPSTTPNDSTHPPVSSGYSSQSPDTPISTNPSTTPAGSTHPPSTTDDSSQPSTTLDVSTNAPTSSSIGTQPPTTTTQEPTASFTRAPTTTTTQAPTETTTQAPSTTTPETPTTTTTPVPRTTTTNAPTTTTAQAPTTTTTQAPPTTTTQAPTTTTTQAPTTTTTQAPTTTTTQAPPTTTTQAPTTTTADPCDYSQFAADHTSLLGAKAGCSPHATGISEADKALILKVHNDYRAQVALGNETRGDPGPQPNAANMREIVWNDDLAKVAQDWAEQCPNGHDGYPQRRICSRSYQVGQNIYYSWNFNAASEWNNAVKNWYDEVADFDSSKVSSFASGSNSGRAIGHYTQVVWAKSYEIGCGAISHAETVQGIAFPEAKIYVCNYGEAGNFLSQPMYTIGTAASDCPTGTTASTTYPQLCA